MHQGTPYFFYFFIPFFLFVGIFAFSVALVPYWFIFKKAGFNPWLSFLMLVPLGNLFALYFLAFSEWKIVPPATGYSQAGTGGIDQPLT